MSYKRFAPKDLVYSTLVAKPEHKFIVHSGSVYKDNEILPDGDFSNKVKHISDGQVSLHELNINRPANSLVYGFISKDSTRYSYRTISTSNFDDTSQFQYGNIITQSYPIKAGLSRIYVPSGQEYDNVTFANVDTPSFAAANKKYILALKNALNHREQFGQSFSFGNIGTSSVNMVCVPGIFYGSKIDKGSIQLNYYITGALMAQLEDENKDGVLVETYGPQSGSVAGVALYEHGLMLLTGDWDLSSGNHTDKFFSATPSAPSWLSFGTGMPIVGQPIASSSVSASAYGINFKGLNKIPTLTMFSYANKNECNFSNNPTFLETGSYGSTSTNSSYQQNSQKIKNIVKSDFANYSASFESTTFISKVGIYDENKNLIAIATLANPIKKTPSRDYMIKMRMDF